MGRNSTDIYRILDCKWEQQVWVKTLPFIVITVRGKSGMNETRLIAENIHVFSLPFSFYSLQWGAVHECSSSIYILAV